MHDEHPLRIFPYLVIILIDKRFNKIFQMYFSLKQFFQHIRHYYFEPVILNPAPFNIAHVQHDTTKISREKLTNQIIGFTVASIEAEDRSSVAEVV